MVRKGQPQVSRGALRAAIGQQTPGTASAQPCESLRNSPERPHEQSDRVPSVVHLATLELACHAGGRGFESRRSRRRTRCSEACFSRSKRYDAWKAHRAQAVLQAPGTGGEMALGVLAWSPSCLQGCPDSEMASTH